MKRLKIFVLSLAMAVWFLPASASAINVFQNACNQPGSSGSTICNSQNTDPLSGTNGLIIKATKIISIIAGIAAVIMVLISGFMYIASGGDPNRVNSARATLLYSSVGLIVIVMARTIIIFVINRLPR